jgi:hypothetical protein
LAHINSYMSNFVVVYTPYPGGWEKFLGSPTNLGLGGRPRGKKVSSWVDLRHEERLNVSRAQRFVGFVERDTIALVKQWKSSFVVRGVCYPGWEDGSSSPELDLVRYLSATERYNKRSLIH